MACRHAHRGICETVHIVREPCRSGAVWRMSHRPKTSQNFPYRCLTVQFPNGHVYGTWAVAQQKHTYPRHSSDRARNPRGVNRVVAVNKPHFPDVTCFVCAWHLLLLLKHPSQGVHGEVILVPLRFQVRTYILSFCCEECIVHMTCPRCTFVWKRNQVGHPSHVSLT